MKGGEYHGEKELRFSARQDEGRHEDACRRGHP